MELKMSHNKRIAVYPGSFDPITNGHMDILIRASRLFDHVIILIAENGAKNSRFDVVARQKMIAEAISDAKLENVEVDVTSGLTVEYAKRIGANHLIRGLRAVTDFEYEFKLAAANSFIDPDIDMIFFMAKNDFDFISSSSILEMADGGVDVSSLVPKSVIKYLKK